MAGRMNDKTETYLLCVVLLRSSTIALDPERKVVHREEPQYPALAGKMADAAVRPLEYVRGHRCWPNPP